MLVDELLKYNPVNADYQEHNSACNIGIAFYDVLRATRIEEE